MLASWIADDIFLSPCLSERAKSLFALLTLPMIVIKQLTEIISEARMQVVSAVNNSAGITHDAVASCFCIAVSAFATS